MKIYEKRQKLYEEKILVQHKCDLCGRESKKEDWAENFYEVNETKVAVSITQKKGHNYPEGFDAIGYEVDLCPWCFKDKLIPWLISEGANIKEQEWSW